MIILFDGKIFTLSYILAVHSIVMEGLNKKKKQKRERGEKKLMHMQNSVVFAGGHRVNSG